MHHRPGDGEFLYVHKDAKNGMKRIKKSKWAHVNVRLGEKAATY